MKVPERFRITITGTRLQVITRENAVPQLGHYMSQLFTYGGDIPEDMLRGWGLTVDIEEDMDQGPEG